MTEGTRKAGKPAHLRATRPKDQKAKGAGQGERGSAMVRDPVTGLSPQEALFLKMLMTDAGGSVPIAGELIGVSESQAYRIVQKPAVRKLLREAGFRAAARAELTADEVISDLRELRDICLGRIPARRSRLKDGEVIEYDAYVFDAMGAARALEKLGDYLQLWNSGSGSAGSNITIQIGTEDVRKFADGRQIERDMGDAVVIGEDGQPVTAVEDERVRFLIGGAPGKEGKEG